MQGFWFSVTFGNGLFVAVGAGDDLNEDQPINGERDRVMTSPDGVNWTAQVAAEQNFWGSVTFGNGLFVAVAGDGTNRVMTSPDGINWTAQTAAEENPWVSVTFGNGLFVAVAFDGTNQVMTASTQDRLFVTLNGNADSHVNADDVANITIEFSDSAFVTGPASQVQNATGPVDSNLGIDFDDPRVLNLQFNAAAISEVDAAAIGVPQSNTTVTISLFAPFMNDLTVSLTSSDLSEATLPTSALIEAGETSVTVTISSVNDDVIDGTQSVTITASADGFIGDSNVINITDVDDLDGDGIACLLYTSPSPRDLSTSRMPSSA